jgi:type II secretory pathway component GspD/PulD (secretin)
VTGSVEADRFEAIAKGVNALLSNSGRAQVDRIAGVIQVTDFAERLDRVAVYLEAVQLRATRQVRLEARVFEVRLANRAPAWVDWNAIAAKAGGGFSRRSAGITVTDPDALVRAVAELGAVTMIAAPQLVAMNNEPAIVRAGTAVTLSVLAQIAADGVVQLHVVPSVADRAVGTGSTTGEAGPAPGIGEADTVVRLKDGETFVLAGILRREMPTQREAGASSPVVAQNMEAGTSELVVLLTPTIVGPAIDIRGQH